MVMNLSPLQQYRLSVFSLLFAASMWGFIWYPMRLFEAAGLPVVWATLLIYLSAAILHLPQAFRSHWPWRQLPLDLIWLALAAGVTNLAFLVALIEGEVMRVMLLFYLAPLWSVILGRWWLGEILSVKATALLVLAMTGTLIMLWQPAIGLPWPHGLADWLALFAGIMFAVNNVLSRKLATVPMHYFYTRCNYPGYHADSQLVRNYFGWIGNCGNDRSSAIRPCTFAGLSRCCHHVI